MFFCQRSLIRGLNKGSKESFVENEGGRMDFWVLFALAPTPKTGIGAGPAGLGGGGDRSCTNTDMWFN